jgi:hypothetical protein
MKKIVLAALAAAISLAPGAAVAESNGIALRFFWYADDLSTTIVGEIMHYCDGKEYRWGQATAYPGETESNEC